MKDTGQLIRCVRPVHGVNIAHGVRPVRRVDGEM